MPSDRHWHSYNVVMLVITVLALAFAALSWHSAEKQRQESRRATVLPAMATSPNAQTPPAVQPVAPLWGLWRDDKKSFHTIEFLPDGTYIETWRWGITNGGDYSLIPGARMKWVNTNKAIIIFRFSLNDTGDKLVLAHSGVTYYLTRVAE